MVRCLTTAAVAMGLTSLYACHEGSENNAVEEATPANEATPSLNSPAMKLSIPTEREGQTWCTVTDRGSGDIELGKAGGPHLVLGRICIDFQELTGAGDPPERFLRSHLYTTQKVRTHEARTKNGKPSNNLLIDQVFYHNGIQSHRINVVGDPNWCVQTSYKIDKENRMGRVPPILKNVDNTGMLYLTWTPFNPC